MVLKWKTVRVAFINVGLSFVAVQAGYQDRFGIKWIDSQRATIIIFNATTDLTGEFSCEAVTLVRSTGNVKSWVRKIQVTVRGKFNNIRLQSSYFFNCCEVECFDHLWF